MGWRGASGLFRRELAAFARRFALGKMRWLSWNVGGRVARGLCTVTIDIDEALHGLASATDKD